MNHGKTDSHAMSIAFPIIRDLMSHNPDVPANPRPKATLESEPDFSDLSGRLRHSIRQSKSNPNKIEIATGITRQALYAVLQGKTKALSYPVLRALSKHLGVRPEWLADGRMPMHPAPELKDDDEIQLVKDFRGMSLQHQRDLADIAHRWAEEDESRPAGSRPFLRVRTPKQ
jgi:transcriptional regulator with XRE-family HTH domain